MPIETYNPQARTFLKKPEIKICPACNQPLPSDIKPMTNYMSRYNARTEGAKDIIFNSNDDTIELNGVKLYKVGGETSVKTEQVTKTPPSNTTVVTPKVAGVVTPPTPTK